MLSLYMLAGRHKPHEPFRTTLFRKILLWVVRRRVQLPDKVFMQVCEKKVKVKRDLGSESTLFSFWNLAEVFPSTSLWLHCARGAGFFITAHDIHSFPSKPLLLRYRIVPPTCTKACGHAPPQVDKQTSSIAAGALRFTRPSVQRPIEKALEIVVLPA